MQKERERFHLVYVRVCLQLLSTLRKGFDQYLNQCNTLEYDQILNFILIHNGFLLVNDFIIKISIRDFILTYPNENSQFPTESMTVLTVDSIENCQKRWKPGLLKWVNYSVTDDRDVLWSHSCSNCLVGRNVIGESIMCLNTKF